MDCQPEKNLPAFFVLVEGSIYPWEFVSGNASLNGEILTMSSFVGGQEGLLHDV